MQSWEGADGRSFSGGYGRLNSAAGVKISQRKPKNCIRAMHAAAYAMHATRRKIATKSGLCVALRLIR